MSFLTQKKTLLVGALSLLSGSTVSLLANQQDSTVPFFTNSASAIQMVISQNNVTSQNSFILQGGSKESLIAAIEKVGASVSREFPIINAVSAMLSDEQTELLTKTGITVTIDQQVKLAANNGNGNGNENGNDNNDNANFGDFISALVKKANIDTHITTQTEANALHDMGITGHGVTVAVLDSGTLMGGQLGQNLLRNKDGRGRAFYKYDAKQSRITRNINDDQHGHGTHVTSIIASSLEDDNGKYNGMAPDAYLLSVKAFDAHGNGSYTDVLDGLNWIYQNRNRYGVRVLNLSLGAKVQSNYWNDPINQAVMRLWDAGVVVVTSAGNSGSDNATITVPGNVPYIITVGAITDSYTPNDFSDDRLTSFSSRGPTHEGFVKPELVSWGGHIEMKMDNSLLSGRKWFSSLFGEDYYAESGTSQAAAVVTGIVALMIDDDPSLSPDDIKCRLMSASQPINDPTSHSNYSPFTQGSGLVNAYAAVMSNASGCANRGLNIQADLSGSMHFKGPTVVSQSGELMIDFGNGNIIAEGSVWGGGADLEGSVWGGGANLEGSVWGGGANLEGSVWGGGTMLEGSVWGGGTVLEGSVWGSANLEGSVWGGGANMEGSVWGGGANLEGSVWGDTVQVEGTPELLDNE